MQEIIKRLQEINIPERISEIKDGIKKEKNPRIIDALVKEYKILDNLEKEGLSPVEAFTRKQVPVIPAIYRAPVELRDGIIKLPDTNILLRDIAFINNTLKRAKKEKQPEEEIKNIENLLYKSVEQLSGFDAPTMSRNVSHNAFTTLAGDVAPKHGFVQRNVIRKRQNLTGRAVLTPDPSINIDEATVPYDIGFKMYEPFIKKEFYSRGYKKDVVEKHINEQTDMAKKILRDIGKERPVIFNRAPSIRQTSVNTLWPIFTEGKEIGVPNLLAGLNPSCDFDGDSAGLHVPITRKGIEDSLKMLPSRNLRWEPTGQLLTGPEHAAATGIYMLSNTKNGREEINKVLPAEYHITNQINKPQLFKILTEIDKSKHNAGRIMNELRKIGDNYAFERGHTIGIDDISPLKELRDDILLRLKIDIAKIPEDERTQEKLQDIYLNYSRKASKELEKIYKDGDNPIGTMLLAKARGSSSQFRDIVLTPIATMGGDFVDTPIEHSYAEGLLPWEYWSASAGARKGIIGRAQQTAMPGALAGELLATSNQLVVGDTKHQYMKSISLPIDNPRDLLDRYIGKAVRTRDGKTVILKDTLITPKVIQRARKFNIKTLPAYSILGSSAPDGSLAAMSYGINKDGEKPEVGTNLGVIASHAIVDPLFTGSMKSFHCFHGDTTVYTEEGHLRTIEELVNEEYKGKILDINGKFVNIVSGWSHSPTDKMAFSKTKDGHSLIAQYNHPMQISNNSYRCPFCGGGISASRGEYQCNSCCRHPKPKVNNDCSTAITKTINKEDAIIQKNKAKKLTYFVQSYPVKFGIKKWDWGIDPYMVGAYIAEGCTIKRKNKVWADGVIWTQKHGTDIHDKYAELLDLTSNGKNFYLYCQDIHDKLVMECGKLSYQKRLPFNILNYHRQDALKIFSGVFDGDGTFKRFNGVGRKSGNDTLILNTVSYALSVQMAILGRALGYEVNYYQTKYRKLSNWQPFAVSFKLTSEQVDELLKYSIKIKEINKTGKITVFPDPFTIKTIQDTVYNHPKVFDVKTESGTFLANEIWAHNTGASLEDVEAGYPRVKQILELQKELPKEAVLSSVDGEVDRITKDKLGGHFVYVNGEEHYIKPSNDIIIKIGDKMTKGDPLSNGPIQPGDLAKLKSLEYAQNYMVEELRREVPQAQRRAIETIVESITRHAKITDPGDTDYLSGDIDIISSIDEKNEEIANKAKYEYLFKGVNLLPQLTQGWASQLNFRHLKKQLRRNIAEGAEEEKHSYSPILSIMKGEEFGKGEKGKY